MWVLVRCINLNFFSSSWIECNIYQFDDFDGRSFTLHRIRKLVIHYNSVPNLLQMFINDYDKPPLEALSYLTGQCNYGGRVTDDLDRRLITSLLEIFYNEKIIFDDSYRFSPGGLYFAPPKGSYDQYVDYIRKLPLIPHPEVRERNMFFCRISIAP